MKLGKGLRCHLVNKSSDSRNEKEMINVRNTSKEKKGKCKSKPQRYHFTLVRMLLLLFSCSVLSDSLPCHGLQPGFSVLHHLLELAQTHVHWVSDAIQPSHPLSTPSPPALNLPQHQGLFQWVGSSHQVAEGLELQQQSFQWIFTIDFL